MSDSTTLVTGATGFAGAHLLHQLCGPDRPPVHAWARPGGQPVHPSPHIQWSAVDLLKSGDVMNAVAEIRPTEIYHLAGVAHVGASWHRSAAHLELHVMGTHHLLEAARNYAPECRIVVVTSGMIYRPHDGPVDEDAPLGPVSPYALSKFAEDELARHAAASDGRNVVIARPFNHIGPGQSPEFAASSFARQIAAIEAGAAPTIAVGNLEAARDLTDVRDVTAAYIALMRRGRPGVAYNICRGETVIIADLLNRLLALSSVRVTLVQDPSQLRPSDVPYLAGDAGRLRQETGWQPRIPLDVTLTDLLNFWRRSFAPAR